MTDENEIFDIIKNEFKEFKKIKIAKVSDEEMSKLEDKLKKEGKISKQLSFF